MAPFSYWASPSGKEPLAEKVPAMSEPMTIVAELSPESPFWSQPPSHAFPHQKPLHPGGNSIAETPVTYSPLKISNELVWRKGLRNFPKISQPSKIPETDEEDSVGALSWMQITCTTKKQWPSHRVAICHPHIEITENSVTLPKGRKFPLLMNVSWTE